MLTRAIRTSWLALAAAGQTFVPEVKDWRLNERHYGGLTGLNKAADRRPARRGPGEDLAALLRRAAAAAGAGRRVRFRQGPPLRRRASCPTPRAWRPRWSACSPTGTARSPRTCAAGETLLVAAHGNSLRAIVKLLFGLSGEAIVGVEIPTGNPLLIELDAALKPTAARYLDEARAQPLPALV